MDSHTRHSNLRTGFLFVMLILLLNSSYSVGFIDPCSRPINCENGTRTANGDDCGSYFECDDYYFIDGRTTDPVRRWILRNCSQNERYDFLREICVNISDRTKTCFDNCSARVELSLTQQPSYDQLFEGSRVQFICCFRYLFFTSRVTVQSFQWSIDGQKITNRGTQITITTDNEDDDDEMDNYLCSTLTFNPITIQDLGNIQCAANYRTDGSYVIMRELFIRPSPMPYVSIYPLTLNVFDSEQFTLRCSLYSADYGNFTWFEDGNVIDPSCEGVRISYPTRNTSQLQKTVRLQTDPISFSCMARTHFVNTSFQNAIVFVINSDDKHCDYDYDEERLVQWSRTKVGHENVQPCPENTTGICSRRCLLGSDGMAVWSRPNCNGCVNKKFEKILKKLDRLQNGVGLDNQTIVAEIASELSAFTKDAGLTPGNLNASLQAISLLGNLRTNSTPNNDEIKSVVQTISNVLQPNNSKAWEQLQSVNRTITTVLLSSADVYGRSLAMMVDDGKPKTVKEDYMVLEAEFLDRLNLPLIVAFPSASIGDRRDEISISSEALENIPTDRTDNRQRIKIWSSYYHNIDAYLPVKTNTTSVINSRVISLTIAGLQTSTILKQPVIVTLQHNKQENIENLSRKCVFWKFSDIDGGEWDSTGCSVSSTNSTHTVCSCDHLTNFAILLSLNPSDDAVLSIISTVGCSISVAALILTVIIYVATWKQMKSDQAAVLLNLCLALIIANIVFLAGADKVVPEDGCKAVAVLLHYFFLAAFFLMLAEGVELLLYIIFVFHVRRTIETASIIVAAWVLPLIIVIISLGVTKAVGYGSSKSCWLSVETGLIWAFIGPALCIIVANFVILAIVLRRISHARFSAAKNEKKSRIRATLWNISVICPVLGVAWVFGVLSVSFNHVVFQYLFAIFNSLQGVLIFIYHALFHNKTISGKISTLFSNFVNSRSKPDTSISQTPAPPDQWPKRVSTRGNVPVLVKYYQGLANENYGSSDSIKQDMFVTSSTVMSSSTTDQTTMSSCDSSVKAEVSKTNSSSSIGVQVDTKRLVEQKLSDDQMTKS